jgi:hypothetical protein
VHLSTYTTFCFVAHYIRSYLCSAQRVYVLPAAGAPDVRDAPGVGVPGLAPGEALRDAQPAVHPSAQHTVTNRICIGGGKLDLFMLMPKRPWFENQTKFLDFLQESFYSCVQVFADRAQLMQLG